MIQRRTRDFAMYLSADSNANSFVRLTEDAPAAGAERILGSTNPTVDPMRAKGEFDLHCPVHQVAGTADRECRVVFSRYNNTLYENRDGRLTECTITIRRNSFSNLGCTNTFGADKALIANLSDYGKGAPSVTHRTTPGWWLSTSMPMPHTSTMTSVEGSRLNGIARLWNHAGATLSSVDRIINAVMGYDSDIDTCFSMTANDKPKTYYGGSSIDYCEGCDAILRLDWGVNGSSGVPNDTCY